MDLREVETHTNAEFTVRSGAEINENLRKVHIQNIENVLRGMENKRVLEKAQSICRQPTLEALVAFVEELDAEYDQYYNAGELSKCYILKIIELNVLKSIKKTDPTLEVQSIWERTELDIFHCSHFLKGLFTDSSMSAVADHPYGAKLVEAELAVEPDWVPHKNLGDVAAYRQDIEQFIHGALVSRILERKELKDQESAILEIRNLLSLLSVVCNYGEDQQMSYYLAVFYIILEQLEELGYSLENMQSWCTEQPRLARDILIMLEKGYQVYYDNDLKRARVFIDEGRKVAEKLHMHFEIIRRDQAELELALLYEAKQAPEALARVERWIDSCEFGAAIPGFLFAEALHLLRTAGLDVAQEFIQENLSPKDWNNTWTKALSLSALLGREHISGEEKAQIQALYAEQYAEEAVVLESPAREAFLKSPQNVDLAISIARYYFIIEDDPQKAQRILHYAEEAAEKMSKYSLLAKISMTEAGIAIAANKEEGVSRLPDEKYMSHVIDAYQTLQLLGAEELQHDVITQVAEDIGISRQRAEQVILEAVRQTEQTRFLEFAHTLQACMHSGEGMEYGTDVLHADLSRALRTLTDEILVKHFGAERVTALFFDSSEARTMHVWDNARSEQECALFPVNKLITEELDTFQQQLTRGAGGTSDSDAEHVIVGEPRFLDPRNLQSYVGRSAMLCYNNSFHDFPAGRSNMLGVYIDWGQEVRRLTEGDLNMIRRLFNLIARSNIGENVRLAITTSVLLAREQEGVERKGKATLLTQALQHLWEDEATGVDAACLSDRDAMRALVQDVLGSVPGSTLKISQDQVKAVSLHADTIRLRREQQIAPLSPELLVLCRKFGIENMFNCSGDTNLLLSGTHTALSYFATRDRRPSAVLEGCSGSGINLTKVFLEAARFNVVKAFGIEIDPPSLRMAQENLRRWQSLVHLGGIQEPIPVHMIQGDVKSRKLWATAQEHLQGVQKLVFAENAPWVPSFDPNADLKVNSGGHKGIEFYESSFALLDEYFGDREIVVNINLSSLTHPDDFEELCRRHRLAPIQLNYSLTKPTIILQNGMWKAFKSDQRFRISASSDRDLSNLVSPTEPHDVYWTINAVLVRQKPQDTALVHYVPFEVVRSIHEKFAVPGKGAEVIQEMLQMQGISVSVESEELNNAFINLALNRA